jgi:hypothetical protein
VSYIKVPLSFFHSDVWLQARVWSKAELILWLHSRQSFKEAEVRFENRTYTVKAGEVIVSIRYLEKLTGWSKGRVIRFLNDTTCSTTLGTTGETRNDTTGRHPVHVVKLSDSEYLQDFGSTSETTDEDKSVPPVKKTRKKTRPNTVITEITELSGNPGSTEKTLCSLITLSDANASGDKKTKINAMAWFEDAANCDVWVEPSEFEYYKKSLGEAFYYNCYRITEWVRDNKHLNGKWWHMDHGKTVEKWHRKKLEEGKVFYQHPELGSGYYPCWQVEKFKRGEL